LSIVLIVNPRSRANRRDPGAVRRLVEAMGPAGRVVAPGSLAVLDEEVKALAAAPPRIIAVFGGDGTAHAVLTRLIPAFGGQPLPIFALLAGGTMNVVTRSLGLVANPAGFLGFLATTMSGNGSIDAVQRRCLKVGDRYGFVFGNGIVASFLEEYYSAGSYGPGRALWIGLRTVSSSAFGSSTGGRGFRGQVLVDGVALPDRDLTALTAATVSEVGLGFKLHNRADEDPDRFAVVAVKASPLALVADLAPVWMGRGIAPGRAANLLARDLRLAPEGRDMAYTIDGDLYRAEGSLDITLGPMLALARPPDRDAA
jgi:diacylglycerol kinase family enzyme